MFIFLGIALYLLLNWSYTTAVFTDPGSPTVSQSTDAGYSHLPTHEPTPQQELPSFTVKSTGGARFCKKCQARKPDRAHHCSTCKRCVLKMDHHCPWLATCVGFWNYKAFLLFCIYVTLFCWVCFGVSATWLWSELFNDSGEEQGLLAVNMVLLCVLAGILGLVLTGFTGWHLSLAWRGQTTIECLEKTRYLSPLRKSLRRHQLGVTDENASTVQRYGQQLAEIHANALPGITREEEGEERASPVPEPEFGIGSRNPPGRNYNEMERSRERQRYEDYLDELDSEKLPHAFDLGWKTNLTQLFGDKPLLWAFPICNSIGDGWHWEPSTKWITAREDIRQQREAQWRERERIEHQAGWGTTPNESEDAYTYTGERYHPSSLNRSGHAPPNGIRSSRKADKILGRSSDSYFDGHFEDDSRPSSGMSMKTLRRKSSFENRSDDGDDQYEVSSDEEGHLQVDGHPIQRQEDTRLHNMTNGHSSDDEWRDWD